MHTPPIKSSRIRDLPFREDRYVPRESLSSPQPHLPTTIILEPSTEEVDIVFQSSCFFSPASNTSTHCRNSDYLRLGLAFEPWQRHERFIVMDCQTNKRRCKWSLRYPSLQTAIPSLSKRLIMSFAGEDRIGNRGLVAANANSGALR
jgi:hypothetical protein